MGVIIEFAHSRSAECETLGKGSAARAYMTVVNSLLAFVGRDDLTFAELTPELLKRFERHLFSENLEYNTVSVYMRMLRALCNLAPRSRSSISVSELFKDVFTGSVSSHKRSVSLSIIQAMIHADLGGQRSEMAFARDMFILSYYLCGIPFVDLAHLRKNDLQNGCVSYCRQKTGNAVIVAVEPCALAIIRHYEPECRDSSYLLPILKNASADDFQHYQSALRVYNKRLTRISTLLHLEEKVTSYTPRHTWSTEAHHRGVNIGLIRQVLGHSTEAMTRRYLSDFDREALQGATRLMISQVQVQEEEGVRKERTRTGKQLPDKGILQKWVHTLKAWWENER